MDSDAAAAVAGGRAGRGEPPVSVARPRAPASGCAEPQARSGSAEGAVAIGALAATLAACGGGGGEGDGASAGTPTSTTVASDTPTPASGAAPTVKEAARFLAQAATGASAKDLSDAQALGLAGWLDAQLAMPRSFSVWDWMIARGYGDTSMMNGVQNVDAALWRSLVVSTDTLRQRVALALSEILVVGIDGLNISWRGFAAAAWFDLLLEHAFGNYRTLLQAVSTNAAMGVYLTFRGNVKANAATGTEPDENYARELMQLFTIGLVQLAADGTPRLVNGAPQETYGQDDILGLARVFTGWDFDGSDNTTPDRLRRPMVQVASRHETGAKQFLGTTIPAGTDGVRSLTLALDAIFAHPNVPPFVSRQLIQRLVTSNPSPAYVARIAAVFANDGRGVRGNLAAVVRAILLDTEARASAWQADPAFGKLREPMLRLVAWARLFGAASPSDAWAIGNTSDPATRLGQSPLRSSSVFNFFRPGYVPPGGAIAAHGLLAPEFQITNESTVIGYVNYLQTLISNGTGDVKADYTEWLAIADDAGALVTRLDERLAGGALSSATIASITTAVGSIATTSATGRANRVYAAVLLVMASPEYLVQK